jgi:hypothetical protein
MKTFALAAMLAILAGEAVVTGAVQISPRDGSEPIRVWGGYGVYSLGGHDYLPLGDRGFAQRTAGAIGGLAQGITLTISGIEDAALALLEPDEVKGASVVITRLIFASDAKTLLDAQIFERGRGDAISLDDTIGKSSAVNYAVESAARSLGRSGARMRADSDQRLIDPDDGYFKNAAYAGQKQLFWGGKRPTTGAAAVSAPPFGSFGT